jgi:hypothetical protein
MIKWLDNEYLNGHGFWHYFSSFCVWIYEHDATPLRQLYRLYCYAYNKEYKNPYQKRIEKSNC